jgi:hypothetical protein
MPQVVPAPHLFNVCCLIFVCKAQVAHVRVGTCHAVCLAVSPAEAEHNQGLQLVALQAFDQSDQVVLQICRA